MVEDYPEYIIKHRINEDGETQFFVKWIGCDVSDNTWESEEKLLTEWPFSVRQYKEKMDVDPQDSSLQQRPKSLMSADKVFEYTNSVQDWESEVESIVYVEKSKLPGLVVYIKWKNGLKSVHHSTEVYHKCPQKMLDYFENHRKFKLIAHSPPL